MRYDGTTGAFIDAFVTAGSGGLGEPTFLVFGPDPVGVPEPGTIALLTSGLGAALLLKRRMNAS